MSRTIDTSKKLTKDELEYLEARDFQLLLAENKAITAKSSKENKKVEEKALVQAEAESANHAGLPQPPVPPVQPVA